MTTTVRRIGACTEPATVLIEGRSQIDGGLAYGRLEVQVHACDGHARTARAEWIFPPLTAFTAIAEPVAGRRCGDAVDAG
ncbi:hypothetical protein [Streptomyces violaceusniger]|uniref:hypothetical protein n=1 Tax=Streptomyces violaceusniger TaxID=68280 RepID=UPI0038151367